MNPNPQPYINWQFNLPSCKACQEIQQTLMDEILDKRDKVVVFFEPGFRAQAFELKRTLKQKFPNIPIESQQNKCSEVVGVGFTWHDPLTGEALSYFSHLGVYNSLRARHLIKAYR